MINFIFVLYKLPRICGFHQSEFSSVFLRVPKMKVSHSKILRKEKKICNMIIAFDFIFWISRTKFENNKQIECHRPSFQIVRTFSFTSDSWISFQLLFVIKQSHTSLTNTRSNNSKNSILKNKQINQPFVN